MTIEQEAALGRAALAAWKARAEVDAWVRADLKARREDGRAELPFGAVSDRSHAPAWPKFRDAQKLLLEMITELSGISDVISVKKSRKVYDQPHDDEAA